MHIGDGTLMSEIYARADKWIGVIPGAIGLSGRFFPKIKNIDPNIIAKNEINAVTCLKLKVGNVLLYDIKIIHDATDVDVLMKIQVGNAIYFLYKFLRVKTFKKLLIFQNDVRGRWQEL
jgi:hypothetical protein